MLFTYIVSSIYILCLGAYWIICFASKKELVRQEGLPPGNIISLVCFATLLLLIIASIIYFCYLRYKLKLNRKEIISKTMGQTNKGFLVFICFDIVLGAIIYSFTVYESIRHLQDFIKLHCLFVIMIMYVSSFNGLKWFGLTRAWEIFFCVLFVVMTIAMYFLDYYFHEPTPPNPPPPPPDFVDSHPPEF